MKKIYVVGDSKNYAKFIDDYELVNDIKSADIVIFTGGEDVCPEFYNAEIHPTTYFNKGRDYDEIAEFNKIKNNQLVIGICRGSQLMCVLNGGLLIQDVSNHAIGFTHSIIETSTGNIYDITSTHHQMAYPFNMKKEDYTILFSSYPNRSRYYSGNLIDPDKVYAEPEITLYHKKNKPKCLAIQGHPEYMDKNNPIIPRLNEIINNLLKDIK